MSEPLFSAGADPLARLSYTPDEAARRFRLIYATMLRESPRIKQPQFEVVGTEDLVRLLVLYDEHFLDGLIGAMVRRAGSDPVWFRLSSRMTKAAGTTSRQLIRRRQGFRVVETPRFEIAVSTFLLFQAFRDDIVPGSATRPVEVAGVLCSNRLEALLRIFEHELLHLAEFLAYNRSSCTAEPFRRLSRAIFGHEASVHAMITPREIAATVHSIRLGDRVRFEHAGVEHSGIVRRITKRATVLVPDPTGQLYSDGITYLRFFVPLDQLRKV